MMIYINIFKHTCTKGQQNNPSGKIGIQIYMRTQTTSIKVWMTYLIMDVFYCFETHDQMYHYGGSKYTLSKICPFIKMTKELTLPKQYVLYFITWFCQCQLSNFIHFHSLKTIILLFPPFLMLNSKSPIME